MIRTFGKLPSGKFKEKVVRSDRYVNGSFRNLNETRTMAEEATFFNLMKDYFKLPPDRIPSREIPSIRRNLKDAANGKPSITWFGHSSYHLHLDGKSILVDPVFSGSAAPFNFMVKAFKGADIYKADDFDSIDVLLLTHDHYDHMDFRTLLALKSNVKHVVCSLGVAAHLVYWGYDPKIIRELDWWEKIDIDDQLSFTATPARHFSGRGLKRAQSLWSSFVLESGKHKLFLGGDSGYDTHFREIGEKAGEFDLAILECGQYNSKWPLIHMAPEQTVQAGIDLKADVLFPVHWGKFALAFHPWNEPVQRFVAEAERLKIQYTTPMIGEEIVVGEVYPSSEWWK